MNEAQLFTVFSCILIFGWVGFAAGSAWEDKNDAKEWQRWAVIYFMLGSAATFISAMINLAQLLVENF